MGLSEAFMSLWQIQWFIWHSHISTLLGLTEAFPCSLEQSLTWTSHSTFVIPHSWSSLWNVSTICQIPWFRIRISYSLFHINWTVWVLYVSLANSVIQFLMTCLLFHITMTIWGIIMLFVKFCDSASTSPINSTRTVWSFSLLLEKKW